MADTAPENPVEGSETSASDKPKPARKPKADASGKDRREIPGNFSYTTTPGVLAKVLGRIIISERPPQFTQDFLGTVLQASGGSGRPIIPILKKVGMLNQDGTPTERYAQFQSEGRRSEAALEALRTGWPELFRKNRYAQRLDKAGTEDLFREITGLPTDDPVFRAITSTYNAFKEYAKGASEAVGGEASQKPEGGEVDQGERSGSGHPPKWVLSNQINIVLPESSDINVYHAIFKSLRDNLL